MRLISYLDRDDSAKLRAVTPALLLAVASSRASNRAPIDVFIGLGVVILLLLIVLFFSLPISNDDFTYGGTNYYSGPFGGFGHFGGLGRL